MNKKVVVVDFESASGHSILSCLQAIGVSAEVTWEKKRILEADGLVIVGSGFFDSMMTRLKAAGVSDLIDLRLAGGRSVLGIDVGFQVLFESCSETDSTAAGLGQWPGVTVKIEPQESEKFCWQNITVADGSKIFRGIETENFFFNQSHAIYDFPLRVELPFRAPLLSYAGQAGRFLAAVENGPLTGVQFRPESSGRAGVQLLTNWLSGI